MMDNGDECEPDEQAYPAAAACGGNEPGEEAHERNEPTRCRRRAPERIHQGRKQCEIDHCSQRGRGLERRRGKRPRVAGGEKGIASYADDGQPGDVWLELAAISSASASTQRKANQKEQGLEKTGRRIDSRTNSEWQIVQKTRQATAAPIQVRFSLPTGWSAHASSASARAQCQTAASAAPDAHAETRIPKNRKRA